ncbi:MAG: aminoacyl-tRNA hydrolase [Halieaceae bacterium]
MSAIRLIVGLGNPGTQYEGTRHNAGAFFVRLLAKRHGLSLNPDRNALGDSARGVIAGHDLRLLVPETYMNESGRSVAAMSRYYRIEPGAILIAHDELDIPAGESRFKHDGGHGGHNGLRDIIPALGGHRDFWRLRIGIGHPGSAKKVSAWVLSKASTADQISIEASIEAAISALPLLLDGEDVKAMTALHSESYAATPSQED